ncbi:hypothetical protein [Elizabethkingia anophelis]|uniref:hypothetical protein n=1 Tax=Elizabethkingia anophelis TaxID=1117645 RepID=UPI003892403C
MSPNYILAEEFINRLSETEKIRLCNRTLGQVNESRKSKKELINNYSAFLDKKINKKTVKAATKTA